MTLEQACERHIVLLPGFMCDASLWDDMRESLAACGQLHFGDLSQDATIEDMARSVLNGAPDRFVLIGFSMGGYVAQHMALAAPQRVTGLVLLNTSGNGASEAQNIRSKEICDLARRAPFNGLPPSSIKQAIYVDGEEGSALVARIQAMVLRLGKETFLRQLALKREDSIARLAQIDCPTLVVTSRHNQLRTLEESEALAEGIRESSYEIIEDCGHMTPFEKPDALSGVISSWLRTLEAD